MLAYVFILGTTIGSFLNVLIDRLPHERSILGRSRCDKCKHILSWYDLLPLLSFLMLRGKCRYCGDKIPSVIPFIELITGVLFVVVMQNSFQHPFEILNPVQDDLIKIVYLGIISCLIVIFFADAKYHIIPDSIQITIFILSLLLFIVQGQQLQFIIVRLVYGVVIMSPILLLYLLTKGKGMGFGDVKLAFVIGFLMGGIGGFLVLYLAFISGAVVGLFLIIFKRRKMKYKIAFGPFLVLGILTMLFWSDKIINIAKKIYGL